MKLAVMASGRGSNFEAILKNVQSGSLPVTLDLLLSDRPDARALDVAKNAGIDTKVVVRKDYPDNEAFYTAIRDEMVSRGIELIALAGFMRIVREPLLGSFKNRILNIHPALLPSFPGLDAQKQALDYGVKYSGATVHFADAGVDTGPIVIQAVVPVEQDDTEETLSARILKEEHRIYSEAIRLIAEDRIEIDGRKVRIKS